MLTSCPPAVPVHDLAPRVEASAGRWLQCRSGSVGSLRPVERAQSIRLAQSLVFGGPLKEGEPRRRGDGISPPSSGGEDAWTTGSNTPCRGGVSPCRGGVRYLNVGVLNAPSRARERPPPWRRAGRPWSRPRRRRRPLRRRPSRRRGSPTPEPRLAPSSIRVRSIVQSSSVWSPPPSAVARGTLSLMNITPWPTNTRSPIETPSQMNVWLWILQDGADRGAALDLDEGADARVGPDRAAVQVDERVDDGALAELDVADQAIGSVVAGRVGHAREGRPCALSRTAEAEAGRLQPASANCGQVTGESEAASTRSRVAPACCRGRAAEAVARPPAA